MTSVLTLVILAVAPIVVCYLASWYQFGHLGPADAPRRATNNQDEHAMPCAMAGTALERVTRWVEDGRAVFESGCRILHTYDQLTEAADAAQKNREQLQQTLATLRAEVRRIHAEIERLQSERVESARWYVALMREATARLRIEHPPA